MRIMVVDDTVIYRRQMKAALESFSEVEEVITASNGAIALQKLEQNLVDLMILDIEMPEVDGIETVRELRARGYDSLKVILFSGANQTAVTSTFDALDKGADDFVQKPSGDNDTLEDGIEFIKDQLLPKIRQLLKAPDSDGPTNQKHRKMKLPEKNGYKKVDLSNFTPRCVVIASSTGGPVALEALFDGLGSEFCPPILIAQHMPTMFTKLLSERIDKVSNFQVKEAEDGETIKKGFVYISPGDFHMEINKSKDKGHEIKLHQGPKVNSVRPAADLLFFSAAEAYSKHCLGIVLTGMGADGCRGAIELKKVGAGIFIQDKSSVVWGMPKTVFQANAYDEMGSIDDCRKLLLRLYD